MNVIKSVILIDNHELDNFVTQKILENCGVVTITKFKNACSALTYLKETQIKYQLIFSTINLPLMDGYEFIDEFNRLGLQNKQGEICFLSNSMNPTDIEKAELLNVKFIEKPLTLEKLKNVTENIVPVIYG